MKNVNVAVVGATGLVGETMMTILQERKFPVGDFYPLASSRSKGKQVTFNGQTYPVGDLDEFDFSKADLASFSAGGEISARYVPKAAAAKCLVIDNTSTFRLDPDVPLVVPEVNPEQIQYWRNRYVIANPNCSTIQMLVALNPLHQVATIKRINVATYQAVSGAGKKAVAVLKSQVQGNTALDTSVFPVPIAYNAIAQIDVFLDNGYTKEEMKMVLETQKILNDPNICVNPTAVRIPVETGHSEAIHIETQEKLSAQDARTILESAPGVTVMDKPEPGGYPSPLMEAKGTDDVYVGRIREDISHPLGLDLWVVADNIRKGAALNSVQIAEVWLSTYAE